jgi:hypothetical protein
MIPVYNYNLYLELIKKNLWIKDYFPNFQPFKQEFKLNKTDSKLLSSLKFIAEFTLSLPMFDVLDSFEMRRTSRKLVKLSTEKSENYFSKNCCKSHLDGHANRIAKEYESKLSTLV